MPAPVYPLFARAVVVAISCGQEHVSMLTGEHGQLEMAREAFVDEDAQKTHAAEEARDEIRGRLAEEAAAVALEEENRKKGDKAEKRRVKMLGRLEKQREKLKKRFDANTKWLEREKKEEEEKAAKQKAMVAGATERKK